MFRMPVKSSDIRSIGYSLADGILEIEFHSGGIYQYPSVPEFAYRNLMNAQSKGEYFHAHIKDVYTPHRKISG